jgi:hypothetical protein
MALPKFLSSLRPGHAPESGVDSQTTQEKIQKTAQQFARLLVAEIKLYNQARIQEGRQNKDLYRRLKKDIDKSRSSYDKRYSATAAAAGDYFNKEIIRVLADNDAALMGSEFFE